MELVVVKSNFQVLFVPNYRDLHYYSQLGRSGHSLVANQAAY